MKKDSLINQAADVACWSRLWLLISAVSSLPFLFGSLDLKGMLNLAALSVMALVEFRVHQGLVAGQMDSLRVGWMNQCAFALWFFLYGTYHYFAPPPPISPWLMDFLDASFSQILVTIMPMVVFWTKIFYAAIGLAGGIGQLMLACYYRAVFLKVQSPPPLVEGD